MLLILGTALTAGGLKGLADSWFHSRPVRPQMHKPTYVGG